MVRKIFCLLFFLMIFISCSVKTPQKQVYKTEEINKIEPSIEFLKVHMNNGELYVLSQWSFNLNQTEVFGQGIRYDFNREFIEKGYFEVVVDSVALFETNDLTVSGSVTAMTVFTAITIGAAVYCAANPKACFGSCPTFYTDVDGEESLVAEGFSSSVAPSLEKTDIDALYRVIPTSEQLSLTMKNEALETHVIRSLYLLALPKYNDRVFIDQDETYFESKEQYPPNEVIFLEKDISKQVSSFDGVEWFSESDSADLSEKEFLDMSFDVESTDSYGVVVACRQTLLTTFLFYQTLSYMGGDVGKWIAALERMDKSFVEDVSVVGYELGGIEILIPDSLGNWNAVGTINETGPLATDLHMLRLPEDCLPSKVKFRLTKGNWRIDFVSLVRLADVVEPVRIDPVSVLSNTEITNGLEIILDTSQQLITLPGDEYHFEFPLPKNPESYEYFLSSTGYYLEWIRDEWIKGENEEMATLMFFAPKEALKILAPEYKKLEKEIDDIFWNSKYAQ